MKKKIKILLVMMVISISTLIGCGSKTSSLESNDCEIIRLEPNQKLVEIDWHSGDSTIWYLTRPMNESDVAETYTYQPTAELKYFKYGRKKFIVIETKEEPIDNVSPESIIML